jgi:LacI family transcriptional regulator
VKLGMEQEGGRPALGFDAATQRHGKHIMEQSARPAAIFVCNGVMTLGVLKAFEELNIRCPDDVALATFDDLAVDSPFHPHLTTVVQPSYEMGARAAGILIDRIEGHITKEPSIVASRPL